MAIKPELLPEMTVELNDKRKDTNHWLRAPSEPGSPEFLADLEDTLNLVELAKINWPTVWDDVQNIIQKYTPFEMTVRAADIMPLFWIDTRFDAVQFVKDDECIEFAVLCIHYLKKRWYTPKTDRDFIDGNGVGFYNRRTERTDRALEKVFDIKHHYKAERPLVYLQKTLGIDCTMIVNYIHPGHWRYCAGHWLKFFKTVDILRDEYDLTPEDDHIILCAANFLSNARSGWGVHLIEDNMASMHPAGLPEWKVYWE